MSSESIIDGGSLLRETQKGVSFLSFRLAENFLPTFCAVVRELTLADPKEVSSGMKKSTRAILKDFFPAVRTLTFGVSGGIAQESLDRIAFSLGEELDDEPRLSK